MSVALHYGLEDKELTGAFLHKIERKWNTVHWKIFNLNDCHFHNTISSLEMQN